jgi:hypothetical protein
MTPNHHYNQFDAVNINLRHQDKEWLERWRKFSGLIEGEGLPDEIDDEDPRVVTGIDELIPSLQYQLLSVSLLGGSFALGRAVVLRDTPHPPRHVVLI